MGHGVMGVMGIVLYRGMGDGREDLSLLLLLAILLFFRSWVLAIDFIPLTTFRTPKTINFIALILLIASPQVPRSSSYRKIQ
jgi:hypothetical protein